VALFTLIRWRYHYVQEGFSKFLRKSFSEILQKFRKGEFFDLNKKRELIEPSGSTGISPTVQLLSFTRKCLQGFSLKG
jgi:hypothetical protein